MRTLISLAERDARPLLLSGDLGFMVVDPFVARFPSRFFNVGVAEQNMVGLATGLAEAGFLPFVYSIATFASLRAYEFIRNGPVHHRLPVRILGVGGGFEYGTAGFTHHALEDIGALRLLPGLMILAPADASQASAALEATWDSPAPIYYRLGKDEKTLVRGLEGRFSIGQVEEIGDGTDLLILATGAVAAEADKATQRLAASGIRTTLGVVAALKPTPVDHLARLIARFPVALTVEGHYRVGGLGSLVSEVVAERGLACRIVRCGVEDARDGMSGSQAWLEHRHGLSAAALTQTAVSVVRGHR